MPEFLSYLKELLRTDWDVDWEALAKAGFQPKDFENMLVTANMPNVTLDDALDGVLNSHGLAWTLGPKGIRVTTATTAAEKQTGVAWLKSACRV